MFTINYRKRLPLALLCTLSILCSLTSYSAAEDRYMGVGSCSSSNCHGNTSPRLNSNILHNEFVTWFKHDKHSQAYKILFQNDAKKISTNMGLGDPTQEKLCLDCHSASVPKDLQGEKFYTEDGISCERCHGASERWLTTHTKDGVTHSDNLKNGMIDLTDLSTRVNLCTNCHFGTNDTIADHKLIGSGHPRLAFELDTFEVVQPRHWKLDSDYTKRKGDYNPVKGLLLTQVTLAQKTIEKIQSAHPSTPDLSSYYCYSCHHSLNEEQWKTRDYKGRGGTLRLNDSNFIILEQILNVIHETSGSKMAHAQTILNGGDLSLDALSSITEDLKGVRNAIEGASYDDATTRKILDALIQYGKSGAVVDYQIADQIAMAVQTLGGKNTAPLLAALKTSYSFNPDLFKRAISNIK